MPVGIQKSQYRKTTSARKALERLAELLPVWEIESPRGSSGFTVKPAGVDEACSARPALRALAFAADILRRQGRLEEYRDVIKWRPSSIPETKVAWEADALFALAENGDDLRAMVR